MITIQHQTARFTVKPENAQAYRTKLEAKPKKHIPEALTSVNLKRSYPNFMPGMTTGEYIAQFAALNGGLLLKGEPIAPAIDRVAPMLDPSFPEVVEELDPDYVEPVKAPKAKPKTTAQYRATIEQALFLLSLGDSDTAQCVLSEVLK